MKHLLSLFVAALLFVGFASCDNNDNKGERFTDFDVPELTEDNTIQFTATVNAKEYAFVKLHGGKIAVDWGDGEVTKDMNPTGGEAWQVEFSHVYKHAGAYRVKIWSDEVTYADMASMNRDYRDIHVGNCPELFNLVLYSLENEKAVDLNSCPKLEDLAVHNCTSLESLTVDKCLKLESINLSENPKLSTIDVSNNAKLKYFSSNKTGLEDIKLPSNIVTVTCLETKLKSLSLKNLKQLETLVLARNSQLTTLDITGCSELGSLNIGNTKIESFDFSALPNLTEIYCDNTPLASIDVSKNGKLRTLTCSGLGLTSLDVTNNLELMKLNLGDNKLKSLDVSKNKSLMLLAVNKNQLEKEALETIFTALDKYEFNRTTRAPVPPNSYRIAIQSNPGTATCDTKIITDKGWVVERDRIFY